MTSQPDPRTWQRPASASLVDPEDDPPSSNYAGDFETTAIPRYDSGKSSAEQPFGLINDPALAADSTSANVIELLFSGLVEWSLTRC